MDCKYIKTCFICRAVWEISFLLKSQRSADSPYGAIYPSFVKTVTELLLAPSFNLTGIGHYRYQLYTEGYMSQFFRTFAYSLTFERSVYQSDWTVIENNLRSLWCIHLGKSVLFTTLNQYMSLHEKKTIFIYLKLNFFYFYTSLCVVDTDCRFPSRKHAYIILTPLNPTLI